MVDSQTHASGRTWHRARPRPVGTGDKTRRPCLAGQARTGVSPAPHQKLRSSFPPNALPCADIPSARIHQRSALPSDAGLPDPPDTAPAWANTGLPAAPMQPWQAADCRRGFCNTAAETLCATQLHHGASNLQPISAPRRSAAGYSLHSRFASFVPWFPTSLVFRLLACFVAASHVVTWAMSPEDFVPILNRPPAHGRALLVARNPVFVEPHNGANIMSHTYEYLWNGRDMLISQKGDGFDVRRGVYKGIAWTHFHDRLTRYAPCRFLPPGSQQRLTTLLDS